MPILDIVTLGHPVLRARAAPVPDPTAPEVVSLAEDMAQTMAAAPGIGLAAPQVGRSRRVIVFRLLGAEGRSGAKSAPIQILVNPGCAPVGPGLADALEGCLSIPGYRGLVRRPRHIRYWGVDCAGARIEGAADGLLARLIQHEVDHLNGVLYLDRLAWPHALATDRQAHHLVDHQTPDTDGAVTPDDRAQADARIPNRADAGDPG